jgi:threonine aldolase
MTTSEAVVFFNPVQAKEFEYRCKQAGQLASKMRFLSAQWIGMLEGGAWLKNAVHANELARRLATVLTAIPGVKWVREPEANAVFISMSPEIAAGLKQRGWQFYGFIGGGYRFMCSWATQLADVDALAADLTEVSRTVLGRS